MRLTLRTLLAYLDDMLEPREAKEIGHKIAESETARELVARIKQVVRRRQLPTPQSLDAAADANAVAAYVDNALSPDEIAELEKICLDSDAHLAEVAAVHQILTLLLAEPADVPPPARERMYALVRGREAIPTRRARVEAGAVGAVTEVADEHSRSFLGLPWFGLRAPWARRLAPVAAAVLLIGLLAVVLQQASTRRSRREVEQATRDQVPAVPVARRPGDGGNEVERRQPSPSGRPRDEQLAAIGTLPVWAGWMASPPTVRASSFVLLGVGREQDNPFARASGSNAAAGQLKPETQAKRPIRKLPPIHPPRNEQSIIGTYSSPASREHLLLRRVPPAPDASPKLREAMSGDWRLVRGNARILTGDVLLALPGYRSEITIPGKARLDLLGNLEENPSHYVLEAAVQLHDEPNVDLDVTLDRGRVVATNLQPEGVTHLRLRFHDQVWDIELMERTSKVGVELTGRLERGGRRDTLSSHARLTLITAGGPIYLTRGPRAAGSQHIAPGQRVIWDNKPDDGRLVGVAFPVGEDGKWLDGHPVSDDPRNGLASFHRDLTGKLAAAAPEREASLIAIAFEEALGDNRRLVRRQALYGFGAIDQLGSVVAALDDPNRADIREAAIDTLLHWLGRNPTQHRLLRSVLEQAGYSDEEVDVALGLLRGFEDAAGLTLDFLIGRLAHERLAVRELAWTNLRELIPAAQRVPFDPAASAQVRARSVEAWKSRFLKK